MTTERVAPSASELVVRLSQYRSPRRMRSIAEIAVTLAGLAATWMTIWLLLDAGYGEGLALTVPAAGFLVRLFMIQHDCGHGSFFRRKLANDWTGRILSIITLTPYDFWKSAHAAHHASSGNLDRRGIGDITLLTVEEYRGLSPMRRLGYRLYRNPFVLFVLGHAFLFLLQHRVPVGNMASSRAWIGVMATNCATVLFFVVVALFAGPRELLIIHTPILLMAASTGVWLFYIQHQFEGVEWARDEPWGVHEYALHGSSHYVLPPLLRWFTANIGMHHIHHLCAKIPFYNLPAALEEDGAFKRVGRLTMRESLSCVPLALWDEQNACLISFAEFDRL